MQDYVQPLSKAISDGLMRHRVVRLGQHPKGLVQQFRQQAKFNSVAASGWLFLLFGRSDADRLGESYLAHARHTSLAQAPKTKLHSALDQAWAELSDLRKNAIESLTTMEPDPTAQTIQDTVRRLLKLGAIKDARTIFSEYNDRLGSLAEPIETELMHNEGNTFAADRIEMSGNHRGREIQPLRNRSSNGTGGRDAVARILEQIWGPGTDLSPVELGKDLDMIRHNPHWAKKLLRETLYGIGADDAPRLLEMISNAPASIRFEVLSSQEWVEDRILADLVTEMTARTETTRRLEPFITPLIEKLNPPQKSSSDWVLFERLFEMTEAFDVLSEAPLLSFVASKGIHVTKPIDKARVAAINSSHTQADFFSVSNISDKLTDRARDFIEAQPKNASGFIALSPHTLDMGSAEARLHASLALAGKDVLAVLRFWPTEGASHSSTSFLEATRQAGLSVSFTGSKYESPGEAVRDYLQTLRTGGVVHAYFDSPVAPGRRVLVPWFLRAAFLPSFPGQFVVASGTTCCFAATWLDESGQQVIDFVDVPVPPAQGSVFVRGIWMMQRLARQSRDMALTRGMTLSKYRFVQYGGMPPKRDLMPLKEWLRDENVQSSKLAWISHHDTDQIALKTQNEQVSYGALKDAVLRLANMLLHFQSTAPRHAAADRDFRDQHRLLCLLPTGPAITAIQIGASAAGSLLSVVLPDLSPEVLAKRIRGFEPDVIIATASSWSRMLQTHPEFEDRAVLIIDDAADMAALDDLLFSFEPAEALPPLDLTTPAYVIYTSGSTGEPKGIVLAVGMASRLPTLTGFGPQVLLAISRWDSVVSYELLSAFCSGHTIVIPSRDGLTELNQVVDLLETTKVTMLAPPSSLLHGLLKSPRFTPEYLPHLAVFFPWGEPSRPALLNALLDRFPDSRINAAYGATEFVHATAGEILPDQFNDFAGSAAGYLLPGVHAVDDAGEDLKPGELGRLSALGLDRSLGDFSDLINGAPIIDPRAEPYLMEDWVRILPSGQVDVLGRIDDIISIRGRRVALAEVAKAAETVTGVSQVFVIAIEAAGTQAVAMAVETRRLDAEKVEAEIRAAIDTAIFSGASPVRFQTLDQFPQMANGKIDRRKLQALLLGRGPAEPETDANQNGINTAPLTDLPPMLALLRDFAASEALVAAQDFDPDAMHPHLDSVHSLVLMLMVETKFGYLPKPETLDAKGNETWRSLAQKLQVDTSKP